ncbi:PorP/SprF family type IX secretion system membrane protein [Solitalea koreensis]|uniref:Type IX secretion system membrane protein, PorP/SprF family n=1 Tax=Solitalea koreensis TaxID=543615 RepID=A0A521D8F6_9SPHI|nr:PorP/SprF family type IX secretion system membrane protein [Solitalea koreensis]SMO67885.1 type IX secretion system membrane protein, PorP/SprF family [Solitalea koreensis]
MKSAKKIICTLCISLGLISSLYAQDPHLSQYYASPIFLNPALTGLTDGEYRLIGNNKTQWNQITNPYRTFGLSYDIPVNRFGFGLLIMNQKAGDGGYSNLNTYGSISYNVRFGANSNTYLYFGMQGGLIQKRFDSNQLYFDDQYIPGLGLDRAQQTGEIMENNTSMYPDVNSGIFIFDGNPLSSINTFAGYSISHILEPQESFFGTSYYLPRRHTVHGGARIKMSENFNLIPHALFMFQKNAKEAALGLYGEYHFINTPASLLLGTTFRVNDAVVAYTGLQFKDFLLGVSYDINSSSLENASQGKGGLEITLSFTKLRQLLEPKFFCPRL